jgi:UDP-2,3-diacylglucosamine pyrophosphatase LpxH
MSEIKPIILVVSDIHIGSLDCERDSFIQFLKKILNGGFGDELQTLVILGDFIDLCTDVPEILLKREKVREIFSLLLQIKKQMNLIFILGNHEIPVTGYYDGKFERRKKKFLNKFRNSDFNELFNSELYYQYILLKKWNNEDMLLLYNKREQIESNPVNKIRIRGLDLNEDYRCFMTHGYQFESDIYRLFVGQIWKSLISSNNFEIKETFDYFWNEVIRNGRKIKPITFEYMKVELAELKNMPLESINRIFSELSFLEYNLIKANMSVMKKWERARKPDYYFDGIKEFLEDDEYNLVKINLLIYGHSHHKEVYNGTVNEHPIEIINDGSWQHIEPSYVEILSTGKLNLRTHSNNID